MPNTLQKRDKFLDSYQEVINSQEYKNLPPETQVKMLEYLMQKRIDFTTEQQNYLLEHLSSNKDIDSYLNFLEQQQHLQNNSKGLTITYNSHETQTPTGKISSKTTTTTASTGCLIPILLTIFLIFILCI